ncbi:MAG: GldG family protein [Fulvivirga sp.]|uniref:GldG family protein n=1 Tax=Fulvivirga sp. TaxID=1931237 RepID=UPI0032EFF647
MKTRKSYYSSLLLIIGILVLINILSTDFFVRLDLTENKRYTLSKATEDIVENLTEPVTVKAYFSENLPPNVAQTRQDFKDLLVEYASLSDGNLVYEFINPNEDPQTEQEAGQAGISPVMINVREKDQVKQQKAFLGAVIEIGTQKDVIPFMQPGEAMEYALTTSIKKLSVVDKPSVGLIQGHGEPSVMDMQQAAQALSVLYNFENVTLTDSTQIPTSYKALALVAPKDTIPPAHLAKLDAYLAKGGKLLVALNRVEGNLQNATGSSLNVGIDNWLASKGVSVENKFLTDANCAAVTVRQQQGNFSFQSRVQFPFLPILTNFADHPVTKGLEQVILPFASPLVFSGDTAVNYMPLAYSSGQSGTVTAPTYFNVQQKWEESDFPLAAQTVAAAIEGNLVSNTFSKMVVIGDGDFAINNKGGGQPQPVQEDNVSLFVNGIDWLSDDTGLIDLRTKGVSSRPIDQLEDGMKATLKWVNFGAPIVLAILYGLFRSQRRRLQRIKRMEVSYE